MSTISKENFLKAVFSLGQPDGKAVSTAVLAKRLSITNAATSDMSKKLGIEGLVAYQPYKGVSLTPNGTELAIKVIRRHRLWELFLMNILDIPLANIHDEAEILEHHSSDYLINKIDEFLHFPKFDPHGDPIPQQNGEIPEIVGVQKLGVSETNKDYQIVRIADEDSELTKYLHKNDLVVNSVIQIKEKLEFDNSYIININDSEINISNTIADKISVVEFEKGN